MSKVNNLAAAALCVALLAGCDSGGAPPRPAGSGEDEKVVVTGSRVLRYNVSFKVSHDIELFMAESSVKPRFERARDLCLNDPAYECILRSASITKMNRNEGDMTRANLTVLVRKDKVAAFDAALRSPLPGESPTSVSEGQRETSTENVTDSLQNRRADLIRKTQLRDRLVELQKRPSLGADDLIKIERELADLNGEIKELTDGISNTVAEIEKDRMDITLRTKTFDADKGGEIGRALADAGEILMRNAAQMLRFLIASIPWIPLALVGYFIAGRLIRAWRRA